MAEPFFAFSATAKAFSNFVSNESRVTSASRDIGASRKNRYQQKYQQNVRLPAIMPEQM
jgi:hypothetical protein